MTLTLTQHRRHSIRPYEPIDLDGLDPLAAVDAVITDVHEFRIPGDANGLFTATRHVSLLCHLAARMAAETEYALVPSVKKSPTAATLAQTAGHLGRAIAHYTQALAPLVALTTRGTQSAIQEHVSGLVHHSRLRRHLEGSAEALTAARDCLHGSSRPTPTRTPIPPHTPSASTHTRPRA
ncbi:hypothetical protein [Streptomyces sp. NPDC091416]|uniref:hypothetical protein n=1 Tax=Streptomyces sp. NPDC091416 TaxID=3366003 RepID=UPI0038081E7E